MSVQTHRKLTQCLIVLGLLLANIVYLAFSPLLPD